jgi:fibro-slime domain-containing protein
MRRPIDPAQPAPVPGGSGGFIMVLALLMLLGITTMVAAMLYNAHTNRQFARSYRDKLQSFYAADGMVTLLAQEVMDGRAKVYLDSSKSGKITGEAWYGVSGADIADLKAAMAARPADAKVESEYLGSYGKKSHYGVRWKGFVLPPVSGSYLFYVRSDDAASFYLSKDEEPANLSPSPIAYLQDKEVKWPTGGTGVSKPQYLEAGKRYYFEFLHKQATGKDYGQVGWRGPQYQNAKPIPGKYLASFASGNKQEYDTTLVGTFPVRYRVTRVVPLVYSLYAEYFKPKGNRDTTFHLPLSQVINMRGESSAMPETIWTRVVYYDFHADNSNPEFEGAYGDFPRQGMVLADSLKYETANAGYFGLDSIGKPVVSANPRRNCRVDRWFRAWQPGDFTIPAYAGNDWTDCTPMTVPHDTAFKNSIVMDSLPFLREPTLGENVYKFDRSGTHPTIKRFMPLDNRGFGNDRPEESGKMRNYNFCMELHTKFEYFSGMTFDFNGDDDVWLFINDSLVMDLGYLHTPANGFVEMDELTGLKFGETYNFDLFYCERHSTGSTIRMITNLPVLVPSSKASPNWKRDYGNLD